MKIIIVFVSTLLYLLSPLALAKDAQIYHWTDENGKMHFSDTPTPDTELLTIKTNNLVTSTPATPSKKNSTNEADQDILNYQASITSPEDDQALRSNNGTLTIHVAIEPEKENTQKLQLYLDGKPLGSPQISPTIRALNIDRGTHQVQVELLDEDGKTLTKTQIVTVHLLRASVN